MDSKVFFSCVSKGFYREFVIDNSTEFVEALNKEEHFLRKYASAFSKEEQKLSFSKLTVVQDVKKLINKRDNKSYLSLNYFIGEDEEVNKYFLSLLSNAKLRESFSLPMDSIDRYFIALNRAVIGNPSLDSGARECMYLYTEGVKNTELAMEQDLIFDLEDDHLTIDKTLAPANKKPQSIKEIVKIDKRKIS